MVCNAWTYIFINLFFHFYVAIPQVMSMQKTTCCLLLRLSHATLPGKTNISGCCSSEARSCARWEWYIAIVMLLKHTVPERIHVVSHLGRRAYHLCTVFMLSVPRVLALFSLPPLSGSHIWVSSMIASAAEQRFTVEWRAYPEFRFFFLFYLPSIQHCNFTSLHLTESFQSLNLWKGRLVVYASCQWTEIEIQPVLFDFEHIDLLGDMMSRSALEQYIST